MEGAQRVFEGGVDWEEVRDATGVEIRIRCVGRQGEGKEAQNKLIHGRVVGSRVPGDQ